MTIYNNNIKHMKNYTEGPDMFSEVKPSEIVEKAPATVFPLSPEIIENLQKENRISEEHILVIECRHPDTNYTHQRGHASLGDIDITPKGIRQSEITAENIAQILDPQKDAIVIHETIMARTKNMGEIIKKKLIAAGFQVLAPMEKYCGKNNIGRNNVYVSDDFGDPIDPKDFAYPRYFKAAEKSLADKAAKQGMTPMEYLAKGEKNLYREDASAINNRAEKQFNVYLEAAEEYKKELGDKGKRLVIIQPAHIESLNNLWEIASNGNYTEKKSTGPFKGEMGLFILPTDKKTDFMEIGALFPYRDSKKRKFQYNKKEAKYK
jgi:hypothetical protein